LFVLVGIFEALRLSRGDQSLAGLAGLSYALGLVRDVDLVSQDR
jgi:hypothetical protein